MGNILIQCGRGFVERAGRGVVGWAGSRAGRETGRVPGKGNGRETDRGASTFILNKQVTSELFKILFGLPLEI